MFRLDNILERWAKIYTPLKHDVVLHPSFFRISMIDANSFFVRNFSKMDGCCMAYATHIDAELAQQNPKQISYRHVIYFMAKQQAGTLSKTQITDEDAATEARFKTDAMVQDLLAVLFMLKSMANGKSLPSMQGGVGGESPLPDDVQQFLRHFSADAQYHEGLRGLQLDQAHWGTLPTALNGWQLCGLTIEQITPRNLCINAERYIRP
jgi:hypothetical protein